MGKIIGHMVVGNEADRHLRSVLRWLEPIVDVLHIYDDRSTDDTRLIARGYGHVDIRHPRRPSFLEHEGQFRQDAWWAMGRCTLATSDDWVLTIDADEFLVSTSDDIGTREALEFDIEQAHNRGFAALEFDIPEIFRWDNGVMWQRFDGYWGSITGVRCVRYQNDAQFVDVPRGGGSIPAGIPFCRAENTSLLHVGYVSPEDRQIKYDRYVNETAHASSHVQSILKAPSLTRWEGTTPRDV